MFEAGDYLLILIRSIKLVSRSVHCIVLEQLASSIDVLTLLYAELDQPMEVSLPLSVALEALHVLVWVPKLLR